MHAGLPKGRVNQAAFKFLPYAGINRIRFNGSIRSKPDVSGQQATPRSLRSLATNSHQNQQAMRLPGPKPQAVPRPAHPVWSPFARTSRPRPIL